MDGWAGGLSKSSFKDCLQQSKTRKRIIDIIGPIETFILYFKAMIKKFDSHSIKKFMLCSISLIDEKLVGA